MSKSRKGNEIVVRDNFLPEGDKEIANEESLDIFNRFSTISELLSRAEGFGSMYHIFFYDNFHKLVFNSQSANVAPLLIPDINAQLMASAERISKLADLRLHSGADLRSEVRGTRIDPSPEAKDVPNHLLGKLSEKMDSMQKQLDEVAETNIALKELLFSNVSAYKGEATTQLIPVNIYLDTDDANQIYSAYQSVLDFLSTIGFETAVDFKAKKGSWIKKFISKSKEILTSDEVTGRLKEAEYAVEVSTILKPQSEVEKNQSEALLNILKSLEGIPNAGIRIGSLIVVKLTNKEGEVSVQTRTLSIAELHYINKHPELLNQPKQILYALTALMDDKKGDVA